MDVIKQMLAAMAWTEYKPDATLKVAADLLPELTVQDDSRLVNYCMTIRGEDTVEAYNGLNPPNTLSGKLIFCTFLACHKP